MQEKVTLILGGEQTTTGMFWSKILQVTEFSLQRCTEASSGHERWVPPDDGSPDHPR